jgi:hypothetical protein
MWKVVIIAHFDNGKKCKKKKKILPPRGYLNNREGGFDSCENSFLLAQL